MAFQTLKVKDMRVLNFETRGRTLRVYYAAPSAGPNGKIGWEPLDDPLVIDLEKGIKEERGGQLMAFLNKHQLAEFLPQVQSILGQMKI